MPFGFVADQARRQGFAEAMEATVRSFSGGARATGVEYDVEEVQAQSEEARLRARSNREVRPAPAPTLQPPLRPPCACPGCSASDRSAPAAHMHAHPPCNLCTRHAAPAPVLRPLHLSNGLCRC